jgi:hypothetical protein
LPFLLAPYDSITNLVGANPLTTAETLPATAVLSVVYLAARGFVVRSTAQSRRVQFYLLVSAAVILFVTLVNLELEHLSNLDVERDKALPTALRQGASLALGLTSFAMFQDALMRLGTRRAMTWMFWASVPTLFVALWQLGSGTYRVQGLSAEPSQLADVLVFLFFPACALANISRASRIGGAILGGIAFIATFSSTGFAKLGFLALSYFAARGRLVRGVVYVAIAVGVLILILARLFPQNYVFQMTSFIYKTYSQAGTLATGSLIDRFFGLAGPISLLNDPRSWFGYGLGGDTVYFDRMFAPDVAIAIRAVKGSTVSISSLQGKILMYGGLAGYATYLAAWFTAWRASTMTDMARYMLPAVFVASLFSLGPLFLPFVWLWLAIATVGSPEPSRPAVRRDFVTAD